MLDEATASCDAETDAMVQRLVRTVFAPCTVVTVAHRIMTSEQTPILFCMPCVEFHCTCHVFVWRLPRACCCSHSRTGILSPPSFLTVA